MKTKPLFKLGLAFIALLTVAATIRWFSFYPHVPTPGASDVFLRERPAPQGYVRNTATELRSWVLTGIDIPSAKIDTITAAEGNLIIQKINTYDYRLISQSGMTLNVFDGMNPNDGLFQFSSPISSVSVTGQTVVVGGNLLHSNWKWVDILISGESIASNPSGDPPQLIQVPGWEFFGYGYYSLDRSYFQVQSPHKFAGTNASQPALYFEPHVHLMITNVPTLNTADQAAFGLDIRYAIVGGAFTNRYTATNIVTFATNYSHAVLSFGNVTNNLLIGKSSVLFQGRLIRVDAGARELGATQPVIGMSLDIHCPVQELGTIGQGGD